MVDVTTENMGKLLALCHYAVHNWYHAITKKPEKNSNSVEKQSFVSKTESVE